MVGPQDVLIGRATQKVKESLNSKRDLSEIPSLLLVGCQQWIGGLLNEFGRALRDKRLSEGLRQRDVVDRMGGAIGRSTLANLEAGRERPSERFWSLLGHHFDGWTDGLREQYEFERAAIGARRAVGRSARDGVDVSPHRLGGPFVIEQLSFVYVFRHSKAPEEIIEVRRVRATASASSYGLKFQHMDSDSFEVETESLWGGTISVRERYSVPGAATILLASFDFDRQLRRGQTHEFALRHWVGRDPDPGTEVTFSTTLAVRAVDIHLNFRGPNIPAEVWSFGPLADDALVPAGPSAALATVLEASPTITTRFDAPVVGATHGVSWTW